MCLRIVFFISLLFSWNLVGFADLDQAPSSQNDPLSPKLFVHGILHPKDALDYLNKIISDGTLKRWMQSTATIGTGPFHGKTTLQVLLELSDQASPKKPGTSAFIQALDAMKLPKEERFIFIGATKNNDEAVHLEKKRMAKIESEFASEISIEDHENKFSINVEKINPILDLKFSDDGNFLIIKNEKNQIYIFDFEKKTLRQKISYPQFYSNHSISSDERLATSDWDGKITILDTNDGQKIQEWESEPIQNLSFAPNGIYLASLHFESKKVILWDSIRGKKLKSFQYTRSKNLQLDSCLEFSKNSSYLATCFQNEIKVWNLLENKIFFSKKFKDPVSKIHFLKNNQDIILSTPNLILKSNLKTKSEVLLHSSQYKIDDFEVSQDETKILIHASNDNGDGKLEIKDLQNSHTLWSEELSAWYPCVFDINPNSVLISNPKMNSILSRYDYLSSKNKIFLSLNAFPSGIEAMHLEHESSNFYLFSWNRIWKLPRVWLDLKDSRKDLIPYLEFGDLSKLDLRFY